MIEKGLVVACIGYLMCFVVLSVIWAVLALMKKIMSREDDAPKTVAAPVAPVQEPVVAQQNDDEMIAVITAAVAASLNTSTYNLNIKSFRKVSGGVSRWGIASVNDNLSNKL